MALQDRINDPKIRRGFPCSIGKLLADLPNPEADALNVMLSGTPERRWSQTEIYDAVTSEGYEVGRQQINHHRAGRCGCFEAKS